VTSSEGQVRGTLVFLSDFVIESEEDLETTVARARVERAVSGGVVVCQMFLCRHKVIQCQISLMEKWENFTIRIPVSTMVMRLDHADNTAYLHPEATNLHEI